MVHKPFLVGAYASVPSGRQLQEDYYRLLSEQPWVSGIELPFPGDLENNWEWLMSQIPQHWDFNTITAIPGTMQSVWKNSKFGLASTDFEGRQAALSFFKVVNARVHDLHDRSGRKLISAVQIHSAPTNSAHYSSFKDSVYELSEWDWSGAELVIEHCDSPSIGRKPEKGFLKIEDEIAIAKEIGIGVHINWGRSCLEERDSQAPLRHLRKASERNVLSGIIFSGVSDKATEYGYEWIDGHVPMSLDEPKSLMGKTEIAACTQNARSGKYFGAKICVPTSASLRARIAMIKSIYDVVADNVQTS
ncbi:MAG: DUF4862 family protein [Actinomycetaceae bacterium]|nr:DUF4862 family protein [Actinomycetaceae bacterium]